LEIRKQKEENERKRKEKQREAAKITTSESTTNSSEDAMELDGIGINTSITNIAIQKKKGIKWRIRTQYQYRTN